MLVLFALLWDYLPFEDFEPEYLKTGGFHNTQMNLSFFRAQIPIPVIPFLGNPREDSDIGVFIVPNLSGGSFHEQ